ncbi:hypothetical protein Salat_2133200 [Sesamum alatum]|uniref:Uncharacterized protein n=1 Tax=Sesamum alatum TaxID=300844 RepID=A0AAE1Y122_9LAMI|nr:hypothetical protein Salat_2133200 [Sesamum alatum]
MKATFVTSLVEHKKHANFNRNGVNFHIVMCAIYDVNKEHSTRHSYAMGDNKLRKLKERYVVFFWILKVSGVFVNKVGRYVLVDDAVWEMIIKIGTTSVDSTSLWHFLEEYYASDEEDEVNSLLALPAAPPPSPDPSYVSVEHTSSSASNEINEIA